jgi:hypothetical protein
MRFVNISWYHTWRLWKEIEWVSQIFYMWCLQTETFPKKNQRVEKDAVRFGVKMTVEFEFDYEMFSTIHIEHVVLHVKFGTFYLLYITN